MADGEELLRTGVVERRLDDAEPGIWIIIFGDLAVFSLFFVAYALYYRWSDGAYAAQQSLLNRDIGLANTILLLTSSLLVALGVRAARLGLATGARHLALAIVCGLGFVLLKGIEWSEKFAQGITVATSEFFMFYFTLCGIHLAHVLIGLVVLALLCRHVSARRGGANMMLVAGGALFWHLVDILWVLLFPLLYLVRA